MVTHQSLTHTPNRLRASWTPFPPPASSLRRCRVIPATSLCTQCQPNLTSLVYTRTPPTPAMWSNCFLIYPCRRAAAVVKPSRGVKGTVRWFGAGAYRRIMCTPPECGPESLEVTFCYIGSHNTSCVTGRVRQIFTGGWGDFQVYHVELKESFLVSTGDKTRFGGGSVCVRSTAQRLRRGFRHL